MRRALALALVLLALPSLADAHRLAPSFVEVTEGVDGLAEVVWKTPRLVTRGTRLEPVLPCPQQGEARGAAEATAWVARWTMDCGERPLVGLTLGVDGLDGSGTDALVRVVLRDGRQLRAILTAATPRYTIPDQEDRLTVARSYLVLGGEHLFGGLDHVLFVLGLLGLLGATRALLLAITSFTIGHSFTLAIAALDLVRLPPGPVEIGIAITLIVLARELASPEHRERSLLARHPGLMPFAFGLLHGLGFAGALAELGLPQEAVPLALLSFNVGIELGQLAIVALVLPVIAWLARRPAWPRWLGELPATAIGTLGVYWGLTRTVEWLTL